MATLDVQVNTGIWEAVSADRATVTRRVALAEASFRIPDATVVNRDDLRSGREVRISITEGGYIIRFTGYIEKAKPVAAAPGAFDLEVSCVGYEYGATLRAIQQEVYPDKLENEQELIEQPGSAAGKDAYVYSMAATTNYGGAPQLIVSADQGINDDKRRAYLEFDLSSIPQNSRIEKAELYLHLDPVYANEENTQNIGVHAVTQSWTELGLTWSNQPAFESSPDSVTKVANAEGDWHKWDLTNTVQRWIDGTLSNYGAVLVNQQEANNVSNNAKAFYSSDEPTYTTLVPYLRVIHRQSVTYTDALIDLWNTYWSAIDTYKVEATTKRFGQRTVVQYRNLADVTKSIMEQLPGYRWWIEWDGAMHYLRAEPPGISPTGKTITEDDVHYTWEMEPSNTDIRNLVYVIGGEGGGDTPGDTVDPGEENPLYPVRASASDTNSIVKFGTRIAFVRNVGATSRQEAQDAADAEVEATAWEYWTVTVQHDDFDLEPGDGVTLSIPSAGVDGINFSNDYQVIKTEDTFRRARVTREVTLREATPTG